MESERIAFEKILENNRYDSVTRKVFADWLEERGYDDLAFEERRKATEKWVEADQWMHHMATLCGQTCLNFGEDDVSEIWKDITYKDLIDIGFQWLKEGSEGVHTGTYRKGEKYYYGNYFVQRGSHHMYDLFREGDNKKLYWKNWQIITGVYVEEYKQSSPFTCTC